MNNRKIQKKKERSPFGNSLRIISDVVGDLEVLGSKTDDDRATFKRRRVLSGENTAQSAHTRWTGTGTGETRWECTYASFSPYSMKHSKYSTFPSSDCCALAACTVCCQRTPYVHTERINKRERNKPLQTKTRHARQGRQPHHICTRPCLR